MTPLARLLLLFAACAFANTCGQETSGIMGDVLSEADTTDRAEVLPDPESDSIDASEFDDEVECSSVEDCEDGDPCTVDTCSTLGSCEYSGLDADGDDFLASHAPSGEDCGGLDCDDTDDTVHPGAEDLECDDIDKNCNGTNQELIDDDGDGWIEDFCEHSMVLPAGYEGMGDCDDEAADVVVYLAALHDARGAPQVG